MNRKFEAEAKMFCTAIKALAESEYAIENLESYLSYNFDKWLAKWASTPEDIATELKQFASITAD